MLINEISISVTAGHGGPGKVSFGPKGMGPDGGNGGKGGNIVLKVTTDLTALNQFSKEKNLRAQNGEPGRGKKQYGKNAPDLVLTLPIGTNIKNVDTGEEIDLLDKDQEILICRGGRGGRGNFEFRSATNQAPMYAQPGLPGIAKKLDLTLKFLAKYGFIGLPNAGKSSLLNQLTNADAKVGAYPFTTLEANLGVCNNLVLADVPGLIEGASTGRGLGTRFLKYIDKIETLFHCVAADSDTILTDYTVVSNEITSFDKDLANKNKIILLTKTDLINADDLKSNIKLLTSLKLPILQVSIYNPESLTNLKSLII